MSGTNDDKPVGAVGKVVWITGYSASGKTTVGRRVEGMLRERGRKAVFLDGDDLRSILASRWGYTREERVDLAHVYFRLCSLLSSQGIMVVISAVAMYDDVRDWLTAHVPGVVEVYLDVPESERRERDRVTKRLYDEVGSMGGMYDEPKSPDLVVANYGGVSAAEAASQIVEYLDRCTLSSVDHGRHEHWQRFYSGEEAPQEPSSFARLVCERIEPPATILEVGCGNGRDSAFFAAQGFDVTAVDLSRQAIEACVQRHRGSGVAFHAGDVRELPSGLNAFDVVYSRFTLHAMTPEEEDGFIAEAAARLEVGGRLLVECRSINDPLAREGEVISRTERIHGHYRRFIVPHELRGKLNGAGFRVDHLEEKGGVAKLGDDDPVVIRSLSTRIP